MTPSSLLAALTERELEVLGLIADGLSNEAIGRRLAISVKTVESIGSAVFRKLLLIDSPDANRRVQAAVMYLAESPSARGLGGIPVRRNAFVGRTDELDDLSLLAGHHRWLTITGPGGSGKTSLATAFAVRHVESGGTACFVDLTQTRNPDGILAAVLDACGVIARDERVGLRRLRKALASTPMLLVCDNGEHVSSTLGGLLDDLLDAPQLSVLVTSRTPLRGDGEHVWVIPPMRYNQTRQLLAERSPVEVSDAAAESICDAADGMPLAIELLAARLQSADADYIVSQLDSLPALLDADGPGRHLSISAALGASFAALDPATGRACSQLAAIPAGFTLDTATACIEASVDTDVAAIVETLVQASIVSLRSGRYQMLEPVRQYALQRLPDDAQRDASRAFVTSMVQYAGRAAVGLTKDPRRWSQTLRNERGNLDAALDVAIKESMIDQALQLLDRLNEWWTTSEATTAHLRTALRVIDCADHNTPPRQLGRALTTTGVVGSILASSERDWPQMLATAVDLLEQCGDDHGLAVALFWSLQYAPSIDALDRAIAIAERIGNNYLLGWSLISKASLLTYYDRPIDERNSIYERARHIGEHHHLASVTAGALIHLVNSWEHERAAGRHAPTPADLSAAADKGEQLARTVGEVWPIHEALLMQARRRLTEHDHPTATPYIAELIAMSATSDSRDACAEVLLVTAALIELRGNPNRASELAQLSTTIGSPRHPQWTDPLPTHTRHTIDTATHTNTHRVDLDSLDDLWTQLLEQIQP